MKTALILNGGGAGQPYAEITAGSVSWARSYGYEPSAFDLTGLDIKPCRGCFNCWLRTPGRCSTRDDQDLVIAHHARSELLVLITPVVFGGYGFHLKKSLDRSIPILLPFFEKVKGELHHPMRYALETRRLAAVGVLPEPDPESERIFHEVVRRHSINLHARPASVVVREAEDGWTHKLDALFEGEEN
jgi:hypothetical protein